MCWSFNFMFRYIDDVLSLSNSKLGDFFDRIYTIELEILDTTDTYTDTTESERYLQTSDFWLQTSDFRLLTSDFGLRISNFGLHTSDITLQTSDFRIGTSDLRCYISLFLLRTSHFRFECYCDISAIISHWNTAFYLDRYCFVCLRVCLVYSMLPVSLNYPYLYCPFRVL